MARLIEVPLGILDPVSLGAIKGYLIGKGITDNAMLCAVVADVEPPPDAPEVPAGVGHEMMGGDV